MSIPALQRTVRRCTALIVAVLGFGFDGVSGFDGTLLVVGALGYFLVSGFLQLSRRYDRQIGLYEDGQGEAETDDRAESPQ